MVSYKSAIKSLASDGDAEFPGGTMFRIGDGFWATAAHLVMEFNENLSDRQILLRDDMTVWDIHQYQDVFQEKVDELVDLSFPSAHGTISAWLEAQPELRAIDIAIVSGAEAINDPTNKKGLVSSDDAGLVTFISPTDAISRFTSGDPNPGFLAGAEYHRYGETTGHKEGDVDFIGSAGNFRFTTAAGGGDSGGGYFLEYEDRMYVFGVQSSTNNNYAFGTYFKYEDWQELNTIISLGQSGDVTYDEPHNMVVGSSAGDTFTGSYRADRLLGRDGDDVISDGDDIAWGDDTLDGGDGADTLTASQGNDTMLGGSENDILIGGVGRDWLDGGTDNDALFGGGDDDSLFGGNGSDTLEGGSGGDVLNGGDGIDTLRGDSGLDALYGGEGEDTLDGGSGYDILDGGDDDDTLVGGADDDTLSGGEGNDVLWGGAKDSEYSGVEDGSDTADYSLASTPIRIELNAETFDITIHDGGGGTDTLHSIEKIIGTSGFDYVNITGYISSNFEIDGGGGQAGDSADVINAGDRGVTVAVGLDLYINEYGNGSVGNVGGGGGVITLSGFHTQIVASNYDDVIVDYSGGHKRIDGGDGNDIVDAYASSGNVILYGGDGNDQVNGGSGHDILIGGSSMYVASTDVDNMIGGAGNDLIVVNGTGIVSGGDGEDRIRFLFDGGVASGGSGNDYIEFLSENYVDAEGGEGNDVINAEEASAAVIRFSQGDGHDALNLAPAVLDIRGETDSTLYTPDLNIILQGIDEEDVTFVIDVDSPTEGYGAAEVALLVESTGDSIYLGERIYFWSEYSGLHMLLYTSLDGGAWGFSTYFYDTNVEFLVGSVDSYRVLPAGTEGSAPPSPEDSTGTPGDDDLRGSSGDDSISGGDGDDTIETSGGNDTVSGGFGTDTLSIFGSRTNFEAVATEDGFVITDETGLEGEITVTGVERVFFITDGEGYSIGELVTSFATAGNDELDGNAFDNEIFGLAGNDVLSGLAGNDNLVGGTGDDVLQGGEGHDSLIGDAGVDAMAGGDGDDHYQVDDPGDTIEESTGEGYDTVDANISYVLGANVERLVLRGYAAAGTGNGLDNEILGNRQDNTLSGFGGNDLLDGADGNDNLVGGAGDDHLTGGEGGDHLNGGSGADEMTGGNGDDHYTIDDVGDIAAESADEGYDFVESGISYVLGANVEGLRLSGDLSTDGTGNALDNEIYGNASANILTGLDGHDWLAGGDGGDTLLGSEGDDSLDGEGGDDSLQGGAGNDSLDGGQGSDEMIGGSGDDYFSVDDSSDSVNESVDEGWDSIVSSISYVLDANVESLLLWNEDEAIDGTGNALSNEIYGDDNANVLSGLDGDDLLSGGIGNDTLIGGNGQDRFAFGTTEDIDAIDDFEAGIDTIELDSAAFIGLSPGSLSIGEFVVGSAATDANQRIIYDDTTGALLFDVDGNGGGAPVQFATLDPSLTLVANDFLVI